MKELLKFSIVGASGIFINNIFLYIFVDKLKIPLEISGNVSIFLTIFYVFLLNDIWTFRNRKKSKSVIVRILKFYISRIFGWVAHILILISLTKIGLFYLLSNIIGIIIAFIVNYITSSKWVWQ